MILELGVLNEYIWSINSTSSTQNFKAKYNKVGLEIDSKYLYLYIFYFKNSLLIVYYYNFHNTSKDYIHKKCIY